MRRRAAGQVASFVKSQAGRRLLGTCSMRQSASSQRLGNNTSNRQEVSHTVRMVRILGAGISAAIAGGGLAAACLVEDADHYSGHKAVDNNRVFWDDVELEFDPQSPVMQGSFGTVRVALSHHKEQGNNKVAVKIVSLNETTRQVLDSEIAALWRIRAAGDHENIVHFHGSVTRETEPEHDGLVEQLLFFELVDGKELYEKVCQQGALKEEEAVQICLQVAKALQFLHTKAGVVHGDIKPENILIDNVTGRVKLIDFGCAVALKRDGSGELLCTPFMRKQLGTFAYCAPEVNESPSTPLTPAIDVFPLGILLYILLAGFHPFDPDGNRSEDAITEAIAQSNVSFDLPVLHSCDRLTTLLRGMLHRDPALRPKVPQVISELSRYATSTCESTG